MKIFLSTSFSGKVNQATGEVEPEHRTFITKILEGLREEGDEIFCAVEHEGWKVSDAPPEIGVQKDLHEIDNADVLLALVPEQLSAGVQFEIGYAVGKGKRVVLARRASDPLAYFNQGVVSSGLVALVAYDHIDELFTQLSLALNSPQD